MGGGGWGGPGGYDKKIIESYIYGIFSNEFKTCNTYHHILLYFSKI